MKNVVICLIYSSPPGVMTSLVWLSMPGALLFFISLKLVLTSDVMIGGTSGEPGLVFFSEGCWSWSVELYGSV